MTLGKDEVIRILPESEKDRGRLPTLQESIDAMLAIATMTGARIKMSVTYPHARRKNKR